MHVYGYFVPPLYAILVSVELALALGFIFVNGFHDTANAVTAVVYTNSMSPAMAACWSGIWNLAGALLASGAVAYGVLALLPAEMIFAAGERAGFAMVFALLVSALLWNIGTWYFGLPVSSSHTLIGSILGVGLANGLLGASGLNRALNWTQVKSSALALLISPLLGFVFAAALLLIAKLVIRDPELHTAPAGHKPPPFGIRALLWISSAGVSFFHGDNDGQKGMGLLMLILIGTLPGAFAIDMAEKNTAREALIRDTKITSAVLRRRVDPRSAELSGGYAAEEISDYLGSSRKPTPDTYSALVAENNQLVSTLSSVGRLTALPDSQRTAVRKDILLITRTIGRVLDQNAIVEPSERATLRSYRRRLEGLTRYVPAWVQIAAALAIGLGTLIGWRRIAVTIGERIGKQPLTYGEGACAELVTASGIGLAGSFGLPVSTTYLMASSIAGTMAAQRAGLRWKTVGSILGAWAFTLPVSIVLAGALFALAFQVVRLLGIS